MGVCENDEAIPEENHHMEPARFRTELLGKLMNLRSLGTRWTRFRPGTGWASVLSELALFHTMLFSGETPSRRRFYLWQYLPVTSSVISRFFSSSFCPCQLLFVAISICANIHRVAASCAVFDCAASFVVASSRGSTHSTVVLSCYSQLFLAVLSYSTRYSYCGCDVPVGTWAA